MKWWMVLLAAVGVLGVMAAIGVSWGISTRNEVQELKVRYEAKVSANKGELDNLKKKLSDFAAISDNQMEALEKIFVDTAKARTPQDAKASMMNWIKEAVPNVDVSIYKQILNLVTGSRDAWTARQNELVDISRVYNTRLTAFPENVLLGALGYKEIVPIVITSTAVETAFKTGKDDAPSPFKKEK